MAFSVFLIPGEHNKVRIKLQTGREMTFNADARSMQHGINALRRGALIQSAFAFLTPDEREFLMTGITPDEWEAMFGGEE